MLLYKHTLTFALFSEPLLSFFVGPLLDELILGLQGQDLMLGSLNLGLEGQDSRLGTSNLGLEGQELRHPLKVNKGSTQNEQICSKVGFREPLGLVWD